MANNQPCDSPESESGTCPTAIATERNRYFTGKYMTARDFRADADYFLNRHHLHNRLLHGWGVVHGLRVKRHPNQACANRWVVVEPGIAIDPYGRELILDKPIAFDLYQAAPCGGEPTTPIEQSDQNTLSAETRTRLLNGPYLLCLRYIEKTIEFVPALYHEDDQAPTQMEANRVREGVCLQLIPRDTVGTDCWPSTDADPTAQFKDDCDAPMSEPGGGHDGEQPCNGVVPLAKLEFVAHQDQLLPRLDTHGRRRVAVAPENLTHIIQINWPHGGQVTLRDLRKTLDGKLAIQFDRKLLLAADEKNTAVGVNKRTFMVQYGGVQRALEFLDGTVTVDNDTQTALFEIRKDFLDQPQTIAYNTIYITLRCDFILDCHGEPVDGNHLRGSLPSGNGTPGGIFESWFEVLPDNSYHQEG